MPDDARTAIAADLAERILDEVTRAHQDWSKVAELARALAALAAAAATDP